MSVLDSLRDSIKYSEPKELLKYLGIGGGAFLVFFAVLIGFHYRRVAWHTGQIAQLETWRKQTQTIVRNAKIAKAQQQEVEEILAKDKDFRIGESYQSIIRSSGLSQRLVDKSEPTTGESISGRTEVQITSKLKGLSMKDVTDLLVQIAQVPQLYTKEVTIKKSPGNQTVDIDIIVATLELSE